ncbi:rhomboid family intramembrane serine protease [Umezakia ovalisporum]|jgi:membrane associated rhomboid family serine protease|uniref:Rhomboid family intramembrane serine protease n=2 Tax=Umezakia ovalisporum TaxID=75695 RepID=A0AA43H1E0_9CYAN|nr:rhomboid family intramembrane serine protease [Umezakia ovalisporum]MBI1243295.1 rhomboid family intramembrane serine protease [Nostoc sp. RI_552]MDH6058187.1 rhomboid family intramembrane serine protease [Umezakia ovalisporum FSS-43]MDH6065401.1 rhomboid family intramembrane serine protease [Umezakia ovalisporum FSS-62]MDH6069188.1 rhomboid family intramembrane serine protease [Umezakia ovalisporum APH033B]MDH6071749.1 rhomboid family intramembrane serine protease [Umezakia ovalisporum Cob
MIPISDTIPIRNKPIIIYWLIGINIAIFLWQLQLEFSGELGYFINTWGLVPDQITTAITNAIYFNPAAWVVVFWRSASCFLAMFLHGSFSQILGNLLFLWVFGKTVENLIGHRLFLGLYLSGGIITAITQIILAPSLTIPLIGANGAIAAILGAYVFKFPRKKIYTIFPLLILYIPVEMPAYFYLMWWFIQQFFYGIGSLHIPPSGVNPLSLGHWAQLLGLLIGGGIMAFHQSSRM